LLAMFDNYAPGYTKLLSRGANVRLGARWLRQRAGHHLAELRELDLRGAPGYLTLRARTVALRTRNRVWQAAVQVYERFGRPLPERLQNVRQACLLAQRAYVPHLYHGQPLLFVVSEREELIDPDPQFGWGELATDGVAVYEVPGDHKTMWREPNVQKLAATLNRCLAEARERLAAGPQADPVVAEAGLVAFD
jgi:thioesterase domain-containing protein